MPEQGVEFNALPLPPSEYLMRRSYNPEDAQIPGAIVREYRCPSCGRIYEAFVPDSWRGLDCYAHVQSRPKLRIYSVDVPLVKADGSRWS